MIRRGEKPAGASGLSCPKVPRSTSLWVGLLLTLVLVGGSNVAASAQKPSHQSAREVEDLARENGLAPVELTSGGDGGRVIEVTTLSDHGTGSLREAVEAAGPRKIVFKVGGEIWLERELVVRGPFVTIVGETAPSPGISLMGDSLRLRGHDILVRHLRVRVGALPDRSPAGNRDGISIDGSKDGSKPAYNIVVRNVSVAWSIDEGIAVYGQGSHDIAIENTIVAEGLFNSIHPKGKHSMGVLVGPLTKDILVQNSILMSNRWRNPVVSAGASAIVVNNLIYNPGASALHFYSARNDKPTMVSAVNNLVVAGPDTKPILPGFTQGPPAGSRVEFAGNVVRGTSAFDPAEPMPDGTHVSTDNAPVQRKELHPIPATSLDKILPQIAGARPWDRDETDRRLVAEIASGGGKIVDEPTDGRLRSHPTGGTAP